MKRQHQKATTGICTKVMIMDLKGCWHQLPWQLYQLPAKCKMDHRGITWRVTDKACRYKQARDEDCPFFSVRTHWMCSEHIICSQVVIRASHNRDSIKVMRSKPIFLCWAFFSLTNSSPMQTIRQVAFSNSKLFIPLNWDVTEMCCNWISWRDPALNKTRERMPACIRLQIALLLWYSFC